MNYKIITYLFLSSFPVSSCMSMVPVSESQNVSQASAQAKDLEVEVAAKIQGLLQQGLSVEQIVTLLENKSSDQIVEEDHIWIWIAFGAGAALGIVGSYLLINLNQEAQAGKAEEERLVQEVLRVGNMLAQELARGNQLEAQLGEERRAREVLLAQNQQNEAIIEALNLVINRRNDEQGNA